MTRRERWKYIGRIGSRHWWQRAYPPTQWPYPPLEAWLAHDEMWPDDRATL